MKILITGAEGFVGRNLLENKEVDNYEILKPKKKDLNLLNQIEIKNYIAKNKPNLIIHCAGKVGGIQANKDNQLAFFYENIKMAMNLIEVSKDCGVKKLLNLSSSCAYPDNFTEEINEEQLLTGKPEKTNEGYALAKIFAMKFCELISSSDGHFNYKSLVPCNLYGRYDTFNKYRSHLIPSIILKIHEAKTKNLQSVEIWGDGKVRREFMYSGDFANSVFFCIKKFDDLPNILNIGLGYDHTILDYYKKVSEILEYKVEFTYNLNMPKGINRKLLNINKQKKLGWKASTSLEEGISKTYNFFLEKYIN